MAGALAVIVCCGGHALLVAVGVGAVGAAFGGVLGNPVVVIGALVLLAVAVVLGISRRRR